MCLYSASHVIERLCKDRLLSLCLYGFAGTVLKRGHVFTSFLIPPVLALSPFYLKALPQSDANSPKRQQFKTTYFSRTKGNQTYCINPALWGLMDSFISSQRPIMVPMHRRQNHFLSLTSVLISFTTTVIVFIVFHQKQSPLIILLKL